LAQGFAKIADARGEIARQQHAARLGEERCHLLVDALDTWPARHERMLGAAIRADLGDRREGAAMVAFEPPAKAVLDQPGGAIRALEFEAAIPADGDWRIAAAIEKEERLLPARQSLGDGLDQNRREPFAAFGRARAHVDRRDVGKA